MADPANDSDEAYTRPPRAAQPAGRKRGGAVAAVAIGAGLLLAGFLWGYSRRPRVEAPAALSAASAADSAAPRIFAPREAPAPAAPAAAPSGPPADRMMIPPSSDGERMLFDRPADDSAEPGATFRATSLPGDSRPITVEAHSVDLYINDTRGVVSNIVVQINGLQVNSYAIRALPKARVTIPLPNLPEFELDYRVVGRDGTVFEKDSASFLRNGTVNFSQAIVPGKGGFYGLGAAFNGPFHVHEIRPR